MVMDGLEFEILQSIQGKKDRDDVTSSTKQAGQVVEARYVWYLRPLNVTFLPGFQIESRTTLYLDSSQVQVKTQRTLHSDDG